MENERDNGQTRPRGDLVVPVPDFDDAARKGEKPGERAENAAAPVERESRLNTCESVAGDAAGCTSDSTTAYSSSAFVDLVIFWRARRACASQLT